MRATQEEDDYDFERDSTASQSSQTPRKRLIAKWQIVDVKLKSEFTKDEALAAFTEIAIAELARAGSSDDVIPLTDDLGLFRRAHVRFQYIYLKLLICC